MFKEGDKVEWRDARLVGIVKYVTAAHVVVDFTTDRGTAFFTFDLQGKVWEWCRKPQIRLLEA